jgi:hypothetical protein
VALAAALPRKMYRVGSTLVPDNTTAPNSSTNIYLLEFIGIVVLVLPQVIFLTIPGVD